MAEEQRKSGLIVDRERHEVLKNLLSKMPDVTLNERQICDFELLATGAFRPLSGFMRQIDYASVLDRLRLESGELWPVPICLDIADSFAATLEIGQSVALRDPEGFPLGVMNVEDIWEPDLEREALAVYGTHDTSHPGVDYLLNRSGKAYVGGEIQALNLPIHSDFRQMRRTPDEIMENMEKMGWKKTVGFYTRQPIHRPQFEITLKAMQQAGANLLLLPAAGVPKQGDFDHYTRMRCYQKVTVNYPPDSHMVNLLPLSVRMAGPREALLHMIIGKNYGCTHFVVGHGHASPGNGTDDQPFYAHDEATRYAEEASAELGIDVISFDEMVYLPFEDEFRFANEVPEKVDTISFSGSDIQQRIRTGKNVPVWASFPEVIRELQNSYPPPSKQGFTIFCTGLSGAGKSTIAKVLYAKFLEIGTRPVSLLDGDIVRRNLSSELNFSKEHRDINVRRIGYVAAEITKNRGIAICAPIAPYEKTRSEIRANIEAHGGFIEVHVSTPVEECEKRDRKGMYAKARAGLIKDFTGVDDPYEIPADPELRIDTTNLSPDEAAREVMLYLSQKRYY